MHVLFVHSSFPGQFGHIAARLVERGNRCTFVSEHEPGHEAGIEKIQYRPDRSEPMGNYPFARVFEQDARHAAGVYRALHPLRETMRPDLIVGHALLGSPMFLKDLWPETPLIVYFEDFYRPGSSAAEFRPEWPRSEEDILRARAQNAMSLLHLEYCDAGYSPTRFQRDLLPEVYRRKVEVIHDGIDTALWAHHRDEGYTLPRVVTYVSRTFDPLRGFDIFMRVAKRIYEAFPDVVFYVVGWDGEGYGDEARAIGGSFKEFVLAQDDYDLTKLKFLGPLRPDALARILGMSDLHIYLTAPLVLSWSLLDAMACGCVVLASDTAPVKEVIEDGRNGLLRDFFDVDGLVESAVGVLKDPGAYRRLGDAARQTVVERYGLDVTLPKMIEFFERVVESHPSDPAPSAGRGPTRGP
jgi:glycosyltransferase involved in cell wall biosynthesis